MSTKQLKRKVSRRTLLRMGLAGGIGAGLLTIQQQYKALGVVNVARWTARRQMQRALDKPSMVALGQCPTYDAASVLACLRDAWRDAEMPNVAGKRVLVKPDLIDLSDGHPVTTAPAVVGAVIDLLYERGAGEIVVGDGPGFRREAWPVVEACGLASVLAARHIQFVDLNYDDPRPTPARDGWFHTTDTLWLPRHILEADLIVSVPKLKTHHWAGVSLGLKNLFGIVPGMRYGWPKNMLHMNGIALSILGLYQSIPPMVTVIDGIVGVEGDGPLFGNPVNHGLLAVGSDPVAVDIVAAQLMGFTVDEVDYLHLAQSTGVGHGATIETRGVAVAQMQRHYQRAPRQGRNGG